MLRQRGKRELNFALINQEYLPFTLRKLEIRVRKSNGSLHSFWEASENKDCDFWDDAIVLLFLVCSADLDVLCSGSFSHLVRFIVLC